MHFSFDEMEIIQMIHTESSTRESLVSDLNEILPHIEEPELTEATQTAISKLKTITDDNFTQLFTYH